MSVKIKTTAGVKGYDAGKHIQGRDDVRQLLASFSVSRKKVGRLTPRTLFHLANRHVNGALGPRYPHTVFAHAGPMTLRNSCIVRWLDAGLPDEDVLARAGLQEAQALLRLRKHVHP